MIEALGAGRLALGKSSIKNLEARIQKRNVMSEEWNKRFSGLKLKLAAL